METLDIIEKAVFLISICIVAAANFFVFFTEIYHTKNTFRVNWILLKKMVLVLIVMCIISSCSGNKFINRKYTAGRFNEHLNSLVQADSHEREEKSFASLKNQIDLNKSFEISDDCFNKSFIDSKVSSIKKDSIFIIQKKGKDKVTVVKNNLPDVRIIFQGNQKIIQPAKVIDHGQIKYSKETKIQKYSKICLYLSFVPFLGFVFALTTKRIIKKYNRQYPGEKISYNRLRINLALAISILTSVIGIVILIYLFYLLFLAHTMTAIY
jgi:hypothetical protein